ncbi:ribosome silencing factor [Epibacterium ulvae]|uniref:Ribosomal silencing factor RsfS n=1 Tax=Epibacterium ulvae TaxID=1156985 RepID=A0A1G5R7L8_9RHOB|nr:ribosome silencing factor [Epibacterium ulvae]SCZ69319.1 ribosome-associated protein [Epibacterium ulvae]
MPAPGLRRVTTEDFVLSPHTDVANKNGHTLAVKATSEQPTSDALLARILSSLDDDKAEDVVQIDLRGKSSIGDHMVVASGRSSRQVASMAEKLLGRLKDEYGIVCKIEGKDSGDWVLVDSGDVIVHLFRPEVREFYQIEKMWLSGGTTPAESAPTPSAD